MKRLSVQLSDQEKSQLDQVAQKAERSLNDCVREAVRDWLSRSQASRGNQSMTTTTQCIELSKEDLMQLIEANPRALEEMSKAFRKPPEEILSSLEASKLKLSAAVFED